MSFLFVCFQNDFHHCHKCSITLHSPPLCHKNQGTIKVWVKVTIATAILGWQWWHGHNFMLAGSLFLNGRWHYCRVQSEQTEVWAETEAESEIRRDFRWWAAAGGAKPPRLRKVSTVSPTGQFSRWGHKTGWDMSLIQLYTLYLIPIPIRIHYIPVSYVWIITFEPSHKWDI